MSLRTGVLCVAVAAMAGPVFACNGLLGISQLSADDGGPTVDGGDDGVDGDEAEAACPGVESVSPGVDDPACEPCLQASCCAQLQACAGDVSCVTERACGLACGSNADCRAACRNDNACGLEDDLLLDDCSSASCSPECTLPVDAGSGTDAGHGADAGACAAISGPCNPFGAQCGCPAGESCVFASVGGTTECIPPGSAAANRPCTQDSDCALALACAFGACKPFCQVDDDCPKSSSGCFIASREVTSCGTSEPIFGDAYCATTCDPVNPQATCGADLTCDFITPTATDCIGPIGSGDGPGGCGGTSDCAVGATCIEYAFSEGGQKVELASCEHWCRIGYGDCVASEACVPFGASDHLGATVYGFCASNCALDEASSCPEGSACLVFSNGGTPDLTYTDCVPSKGTGIGTGACASDQSPLDCAPGYECIDLDSQQSCLQWCRVGGADCSGGTTCKVFTGAPTIAGVAYGACE